MKKHLPVNLDLPVRSYPNYVYIFGILEGDYEPWLYSNFLQLVHTETGWFDFLVPQFLHEEDLLIRHYSYLPANKTVDNKQSIINMIIEMINNDFYVTGIFNDYYVSFRPHYKQWDFDHFFMINGYDNENRLFNVVSYTKEIVLKEEKISFDDFIIACNNLISPTLELIFYKQNKTFKLEFNINKTKKYIEDFLNSINTTRLKQAGLYGIEALNSYRKFGIDKRFFSLTRIYVIYEHAKLVVNLTEYLINNKYIDDDEKILIENIKRIEKMGELLKFIRIKMDFVKSNLIFSKIIDVLNTLISLEEGHLKLLLEKLKG
ncbi:MAG: hypothetical protein BGN88_09805 [Clostridiales bacterium 43-6]|nr:MAG: hypothetical protein BGN88_09805 [Clostridiales bacterium 43-6]